MARPKKAIKNKTYTGKKRGRNPKTSGKKRGRKPKVIDNRPKEVIEIKPPVVNIEDGMFFPHDFTQLPRETIIYIKEGKIINPKQLMEK